MTLPTASCPALDRAAPADAASLDSALAGGKLRRVTLDEKAYRWLREALVTGRLPPGQVLTITGLAEQFDISPMPVREALNRLVAEFALTLQPNRSVVVPAMTSSAFAEITLIRCRLEALATEVATPLVGKSTLAEMAEWNRQLEHDTTLDTAAYLAINRRFHFRLYAAAGLPQLLSLIESQWVRIGPMLRLHIAAERRGGPLTAHRDLLAALKARDPAAAGAAIVADLETAARDILPKLQQ